MKLKDALSRLGECKQKLLLYNKVISLLDRYGPGDVDDGLNTVIVDGVPVELSSKALSEVLSNIENLAGAVHQEITLIEESEIEYEQQESKEDEEE